MQQLCEVWHRQVFSALVKIDNQWSQTQLKDQEKLDQPMIFCTMFFIKIS